MIFVLSTKYDGLSEDGVPQMDMRIESFIRTSAIPKDLLSQLRERLGAESFQQNKGL